MRVPTAGETAARLEEYFRANPRGIAAVYLYGSVARGTASGSSDVDVAVLFERDPPRTLEGLHGDLAKTLDERLNRTVDLVILNHAPVDLVHRVLRDGILVCAANPGLAESEHAPQTAGRVRVVRAARG